MLFEPNEDQAAFLSVLEQMMASADASWRAADGWERFDWSAGFDDLLDGNGFYDCAAEETLGALTAAAMIYRLNTLPVSVEAAASSMLRPLFATGLPRPLAVIDGPLDRPTRYLPVARSVLHLDGDTVRVAAIEPEAVRTVESLFSYPMGVLQNASLDWKPVPVDPQVVRDRWRVAVAAELAGSLKGGLDAVLVHVRDREQFGRPLGSFQSIQHRLADAAVTIEAAQLLTLKAAQTGGPVDSATALGYVQAASTRIVYDFHQFMGAMGLTLEHPLHRWTYRAKLLRASVGGADENQILLATRRWGS